MDRANTYQTPNALYRSMNFPGERKTYDQSFQPNNSSKLANLNYNTLENLNKGHLENKSQFYENKTTSTFYATSSYNNIPNNEFQYLNEKYSKKDAPDNVQNIIDKVNLRRSYHP